MYLSNYLNFKIAKQICYVFVAISNKLKVKMMSDNEELLRTAAEQFLGRSLQEIQDTIIQVP